MTTKNHRLFIEFRTLLAVSLIFGLSILCMLRVFGYDRDYFSYLKFYEKISFGGYSGRFEPGFHFISNLFKALMGHDSFTIYLFFLALISLFPKFMILRKTRNYVLMMFIYAMLIMPIHEMTQVRISLACGVMYWALYLVVNNKIGYFKRSIWILIGLSFHYSSIIFAPLILFVEIFYKRSKLLVISYPIFISGFIGMSINYIVTIIPIIDFYLTQSVTLNELGLNNINPWSSRNIIFLILIMIGFFNLNHLPKKMLPWFSVSVMGLALWYSFMWLPVFAHRFLELTIFSYLVWIPSLPYTSRIPCLILLMILGLYFFYRMIFLNPIFMTTL